MKENPDLVYNRDHVTKEAKRKATSSGYCFVRGKSRAQVQASTLAPTPVLPMAPEKGKMRVNGDARQDTIARLKREVNVINGQIDTKIKEHRASSTGD